MKIIVIPCFNEEARLDPEQVLALLSDGKGESAADIQIVLVDDGSDDGTLRLLHAVAERAPARIEVLALPRNGGKAEAVRSGLRHAIERGASVVGYLDADFATPPEGMQDLLRLLDARADVDVVLGARVAMLGREVDRKWTRHLLGRVFATVASAGLGLSVYDTQCGAKAFRVTPALVAALARPFSSRWAFDVELLGRLLELMPASAIVEVPLLAWRHVRGGSLGARAMVGAGVDLLKIIARRRRR